MALIAPRHTLECPTAITLKDCSLFILEALHFNKNVPLEAMSPHDKVVILYFDAYEIKFLESILHFKMVETLEEVKLLYEIQDGLGVHTCLMSYQI